LNEPITSALGQDPAMETCPGAFLYSCIFGKSEKIVEVINIWYITIRYFTKYRKNVSIWLMVTIAVKDLRRFT
jgi:hypothetical protein